MLGFAAAALLFGGCARPQSIAPPTRELMVPVRGGRVYVRVNGRFHEDQLPLVLIHGGPGQTHGYMLDALKLADERAVILYDQLDSGRSDHPDNPANWTIERSLAELEGIRVALGVPRWHVFGHSWGGTVALEYGARRPKELAGLVLASPLISSHSWIADAHALRIKLPADVQDILIRCEGDRPPSPAACRKAENSFYAAYHRREPSPQAMKLYSHPDDRGFNMKLYQTMWGGNEFTATGTLRDYDGEPLLARLDGKRTLLMVGQYDEARPVTALAFSERVDGAELAVVPGAAHSLFQDRPDETVAILRGWLARQDALS